MDKNIEIIDTIIRRNKADGSLIAFFPGVPGSLNPADMISYTYAERVSVRSADFLMTCTEPVNIFATDVMHFRQNLNEIGYFPFLIAVELERHREERKRQIKECSEFFNRL
jgi:hypothetical protein